MSLIKCYPRDCHAEFRRMVFNSPKNVCDRVDKLTACMKNTTQLLDRGMTKESIASISTLHKMEVCPSDFRVTNSSCHAISHSRTSSKQASVELLDTLYIIPVSNSKHVTHAMIVPCQCLIYGFSYQSSVGRMCLELHSMTHAADYVLQVLDEGLWVPSDRFGTLLLEILIGGGVCMLDACLSQTEPAAVATSIKQLLDTNLIQRMLCLICRQLSLLQGAITVTPGHVLSTCFHFLFNCTRMLDFCSTGRHLSLARQLAGPLAVEACKQILSRSDQDIGSIRSVTIPEILLTFVAGYDPVFDYDDSSNLIQPLCASLQKHWSCLPPMAPNVWLRKLAWSARESPYMGNILFACQEAHKWPHSAPQVWCLLSSLQIMGYNAKRLLLSMQKNKQQPKQRRGAGRQDVRPLPLNVDLSNYGCETMVLAKLTLEHIDETLKATTASVPLWQMTLLQNFCAWHVPVRDIEALLRLWYRRLTAFSSQLQVQQAVSLCLYLLCRQGAITDTSLPAYVSLINTLLKIVICDTNTYAKAVQSGDTGISGVSVNVLGPDTSMLCMDSLAALKQANLSSAIMRTELTLAVASLCTVSSAGVKCEDLQRASFEVGELGTLGGVQPIMFSLFTCEGRVPSVPEQGVVWSSFAASRGVCPKVKKCGCWDCVNKEGCSESDLSTKLCSGCRMVRYCSVACQRSAWREGGHALSCGI